MDVCWSKYAHGRSSYSFEFLSSLLILPTFFLLPVSNWTTTGRLQTVQAIDWHSRGWVYWGSLSITSKIDVMSSIENCKQSFTISISICSSIILLVKQNWSKQTQFQNGLFKLTHPLLKHFRLHPLRSNNSLHLAVYLHSDFVSTLINLCHFCIILNV